MSKPYIVCHMMMPIDGLPMEHRPVALKLESTTSYEDDPVWLRYSFDRYDGKQPGIGTGYKQNRNGRMDTHRRAVRLWG